MRKLLVVALVLSAFNVNAVELKEQVETFCSDKWGGDYSMQEYCIKKEMKGIYSLKDKLSEAGGIPENIFGTCLIKWKPQYSMVDYCVNKQLKAYNNLNK